MIARIWRGVTRAADADAYMDYLRTTGIKEYEVTPGNRGVQVLRSVHGDEAEWVLIFYPEDEHFLLRKDLTVTHYEVLKGP